MRIVRTHHVAIHTPDLARLRRFYGEMLGLAVVGRFAEHNIVFLDGGSTDIELIEERGAVPDRGGRGWDHLAWEVADVDAAYAELSARGVAFHVPPEDFLERDPVFRITFFRDPDGNVLELVQRLESAPGRSDRADWADKALDQLL